MEMDWSESRYELREERDDRDESHSRSKDKKKSSRGEEREYRSKERERSRRGGDDVSKERRKDDRDEKDRSRDNRTREKDHDRERNREKDRERDKDLKDRVREKEREKERDVEKDGERGWDKEKEKNKDRDRERENERDKARDKERDKEKEREKHKEKEKGKEKIKEKEREADQDKEKSRDRVRWKNDEDYDLSTDGGKDDKTKSDDGNKKDRDAKQGENEQTADDLSNKVHPTTLELEQRILRMKEERSKKKTEDESDISSWIKKLRKVETKKNAEKEKALLMSKLLEEQENNVQDDSDEEETTNYHNLAGVKVLHGVDKVMEGGAVVLTLKDQNILADGDINEEIDMLENVEIGEQKRRDDAYKAAKKKPGTYVDKFNDDPFSEKRMLPQYDDPITDEGVTLDERGRIAGEAEKKLAELRRRLDGASSNNRLEDLSLPGKISSDYYTTEEMLLFKKPKKKKSLRKKDKLDIDALEADAIASGLGVGDLGSRRDAKRQFIKEEKNKAEAERRDHAYQVAYAKADEASKLLRLEQTLPVKTEEEEDVVFADDDEDLYKSLERARKLALTKKEEAPSGPEAVILLASTISKAQDEKAPTTGESTENKVVYSEMEEFVWSLQLGEETQEINNQDVFMEEDEEPLAAKEETQDEPGGWTEVNDTEMDENPSKEEEEIVPDEIIHEVAVGKGLSGALKLLQDRGTLKETIDWGGRNMDKKKSKLVGIVGEDEPKETQQARQKKDESRTSSSSHSKDNYPTKVYHEKDIRIERTDEFGRILTPKEAFRILSHKFHGKGPGKMKQEKRMKQFQEELKLKQMKSADTPSLSVERMREAQAQLKTPYLVLSGHIKPGQTSDPRSGFATVEKDLPGGLTPMLGDRKVEHFLGIKRKAEPANSGLSKKPKP